MKSIRELQTTLPWTIRYSRDFRANPQPHKDFSHALLHVAKALGHLTEFVDDMDHDREVANDPTLKDRHAKYLADLVVCALRAANTFPGGVVDLQTVVENRIATKNAIRTPEQARIDDEATGAPVVCAPYKADMPKLRFDCVECQAQGNNQEHKDHGFRTQGIYRTHCANVTHNRNESLYWCHTCRLPATAQPAPINPPFCDFCKNTGYLNGTGYCKCAVGNALKNDVPVPCNTTFSKFGFNNASIGFVCKRFKGHTGDHE